MKQFPQILKETRIDRDLSRNQLGKIVGTSGTMIYNWERGENCPSLFMAMCLAQALDVSLDYLAGLEK